jgi:hypothetical protein
MLSPFAPGEIIQTFTVSIIDDLAVESSETILLTLSDPQAADLGTMVTATLTIVDNDQAQGPLQIFLPLVAK